MKMHSPDLSITSVSHDGQTYDADECGVFDVPDVAAADLMAHGLILGEPKTQKLKSPENESAWVEGKQVGHQTTLALLAKAKEFDIPTDDLDRPALVKAVAQKLKSPEGQE